MIMNKLGLSIAAVLGLLGGCMMDEGAGEGVDGGMDACEDTGVQTPWELDEPVPEGFTPQSVLDAIEGMRYGTLTWHGSGSGVTVEPDSGETDMTVQVRYTGGEVFYQEEESPCPGYAKGLKMWLTLDLATADGGFADTWPVFVTAYPDTVYVRFDLMDVEVEGTFSAAPETDDPDHWASAVLAAEVNAAETSGTIWVSEWSERGHEGPRGGAERDDESHETATFIATPPEE